MLKNPEEVRAGAAKIAAGRLTVWNARLDLAMQVGDVRKIDALMDEASGGGSGCGCGCGCGCGGPGSGCGSISTPRENTVAR